MYNLLNNLQGLELPKYRTSTSDACFENVKVLSDHYLRSPFFLSASSSTKIYLNLNSNLLFLTLRSPSVVCKHGTDLDLVIQFLFFTKGHTFLSSSF